MRIFYIFIFLCQFLASISWAQEISYLDLASFFIKDKNYSRAKLALEKAEADIESYSKTRFELLLGLYYLRENEMSLAQTHLYKALDGENEAPLAALYLSEWFLKEKSFKQAKEWNLKVQLDKLAVPEAFVLRAQILWECNELDEAFTALNQGEKLFPKSWRWAQIKIKFLLAKGLFQAAWDLTKKHLEKTEYMPNEAIKWSYLFNDYKQEEVSTKILEISLLFHPLDEGLLKAIGHQKLLQKKLLTAAYFFQTLSYLNADFVDPTIGLLRNIDRSLQAENLHYNSLKMEEKFKNKLALLLDNEDYERVVSLDQDIAALNLKKNDEVTYALAYSQFMVGDWKNSKLKLQTLKNKKFIKKATKLLSMISRCRQNPGECYVGL